jgi:hypothetical protein
VVALCFSSLARFVGLARAWFATKFFFFEGLIGTDFADIGLTHVADFGFETTAAAAAAWFFRGISAGCVTLTLSGVYVFFFEFWHVSFVLVCIRDPSARAVIAVVMVSRAGGVGRVRAITAALAARSAQAGVRIGKATVGELKKWIFLGKG